MGGGMNDAERVAFTRYPELRRLAALRDGGGWRFLHQESEPGVVVLIQGVRVWPDESADALGVRGQTDAQATRTNPDGDVVWEREGDLAYVVEQLIELPPPDDPRAPRLVIRSRLPQIWLPGL
jgi:hypothetical protein